ASAGVGVSVGLAIVENDIRNTIEAYIENGKATATGQVGLTADSTATIRGFSVGAAANIGGASNPDASFTLALAGAGAKSSSTIDNTIQAYIQNGSEVSGGSVQVCATDDSTIDTRAGGGSLVGDASLAGASLALDVVIAENTVSNTVQAWIGSSTGGAD